MSDRTVEETTLPMERLGGGRAAEVFAWSPKVVVKLVREERFEPGLLREAKAIDAAGAAGVPVPRQLGFVTRDGRRGLLLDRIDGTDVFSLIESRPWRVWTLARLVGKQHARMSEAPAPSAMASLKDRAMSIIDSSVNVPDSARSRLRAVLDSAAEGGQLCHLDFHPGNVILTRDGAFVIDWPNALRGPAVADHAKSLVILQAGKAPHGQGRMVRLLISVLRRVALAGYASGYRSACAVDEAELARWKAIAVAMRLDEGNPAERRALLRLLSRTLRKAERLAPTGP